MKVEKDVEIEISKEVEINKQARGKSVIYENVDLKVETLDKILVALFIIIAIVFSYAIMK